MIAQLLLLLASAGVEAEQTRQTEPLLLSDILASVDKHHPEIAAAGLKLEAAQAKVLAARGAFDFQVEAGVGRDVLGKFDKASSHLGVSQGLPWLATGLFGGIRNGADHPSYNGQRTTSEGGEIVLGARFALLRDRAIDDIRLEVRNSLLQAQAGVGLVALKRLQTRMKAAETYLYWLAAGLKQDLAERLLLLAQLRQTAIEAQVQSGALPRIDSIENQMLIFSRQERLVSAQQNFQQAAFELSLFLRNHEGKPVVPPPQRLPQSRSDLVQINNQLTLEQALSERPDLKILRAQIAQAENEVLWARNQLQPRLDVYAKGSKDLGTPRPYAPFADTINQTEVAVSLSLSLPLQMRKARGLLAQKTAELAILKTETRFLRERIVVQIGQARMVMETTAQRMAVSEQTADAARQLEAAERTRFSAGQSSLVVVNLREVASADAQSRAIEAWAEHQLALVTLLAALGQI